VRERSKAARKGDEIVSETIYLQRVRATSVVMAFLLKNEPVSIPILHD